MRVSGDRTGSVSQGSYSLAVLFFWMTLFAIAFAWIESAVVHYLRLHFYPDGFRTPAVLFPPDLMLVETGREICTVIVLATAAVLAANTRWTRLAWFMYVFGLWDISYYIWLILFEGWPPSPFTMDLLFLLPVPWAGPVIAPVTVSLSFILSAVLIIKIEANREHFSPGWMISSLTLIAWTAILVSFIWNAEQLMKTGDVSPFRWDIFLGGVLTWMVAIVLLLKQSFDTGGQ